MLPDCIFLEQPKSGEQRDRFKLDLSDLGAPCVSIQTALLINPILLEIPSFPTHSPRLQEPKEMPLEIVCS